MFAVGSSASDVPTKSPVPVVVSEGSGGGIGLGGIGLGGIGFGGIGFGGTGNEFNAEHNDALVLGPTLPSTTNELLAWNCFTAASVLPPKIPSITPGSNPNFLRLF